MIFAKYETPGIWGGGRDFTNPRAIPVVTERDTEAERGLTEVPLLERGSVWTWKLHFMTPIQSFGPSRIPTTKAGRVYTEKSIPLGPASSDRGFTAQCSLSGLGGAWEATRAQRPGRVHPVSHGMTALSVLRLLGGCNEGNLAHD